MEGPDMAYGAVDPAIWQSFMNYQQDPGLDFADEDVLSDQGKMLTQLSKYGNAGTDLDSMLMLGGIQPGAYDPVTTVEPVDAPGERTLGTYRNGTTYQQWLAGKLDLKWNSGRILSELSKVVADPVAYAADPKNQITPDEAAAIVGELPPMLPHYDDVTKKMVDPRGPDGAPLPDLIGAGNEIRDLEKMILGDPEHTLDANGQPVSAKTEDSAARKALLDAGIVSDPQAGYDPYMFAPSGVTPESDAKLADTLKRWGPVNEARDTLYQTAKTDATASDEAYRRMMKQFGIPDNTSAPRGLITPDRGSDAVQDQLTFPGGQDTLYPGSLSGRQGVGQFPGGQGPDLSEVPLSGRPGVGQFPGGQGPPSPVRPGVGQFPGGQGPLLGLGQFPSGQGPVAGRPGRGQFPQGQGPLIPQKAAEPAGGGGGVIQNLLVEGVKRKMLEDQAKAHKMAQQKDVGIAKFRDASDANFLAKRHAAQRQAISAMLQAQGRSPLQDELNARKRLIFGG